LRVKVYILNYLRQKECFYKFDPMKTLLGLGQGIMEQSKRQRPLLNWKELSAREQEVMLLAAKGFANKAIARELSVAEGTVKLHLHRVYQKLGIKSRFALAALARHSPLPSRRPTPIDAA
jgi:DNA-binding NarL/FixJ family response regulator